MEQQLFGLEGLGQGVLGEGAGGEGGVQESIAQSAQEILARYPIAAGLLRGEAAPLLPTLQAHPPTAFPPTTSQTPTRPTQILGDYSSPLSVLEAHIWKQAPNGAGSHADRSWAERQMAVANGLITKELGTSGIINLRFKSPSYDVPAGTPAPAMSDIFSSSAGPTTTAARHADSLRMPYPTPASLSPSPPRQSTSAQNHASQSSGPSLSFDDELAKAVCEAEEAASRRREQSRSLSPTRLVFGRQPPSSREGEAASTPIRPFGHGPATPAQSRPDERTPISSPDPLALGGATSSRLPPSAASLEAEVRPKKLDFDGALAPAFSQSHPQPKKRKSEASLPAAGGKRPSSGVAGSPLRKQTFKVVIPPSPAGKSSVGGSPPKVKVSKGREMLEPTAASALAKLEEFIEDLLEADDMFGPENANLASPSKTPGGSSTSFFTASPFSNTTLLASDKSLRLARHIDAAKKLNSAATSAGGKELVCYLETPDLGRVLKILERSIKAAEEVAVVPHEVVAKARKTARAAHLADVKPTKGKGKAAKGKKTSKAKKGSPVVSRKPSRRGSVVDGEEEFEGRSSPAASRKSGRSGRSPSVSYVDEREEDEATADLITDDLLQRFADGLRVLTTGVQAANAAVALWTAGKLPKQLYYEEMITALMAMAKSQLVAVVYAFVEADADSTDGYSAFLSSLLPYPSISNAVQTLCESFSGLLPRLARLITQEDMSEGVLIHAGYVSIGPFFVEPAGGMAGKGKKSEGWARTGVKVLRMGALDMLRAIVARSPSQREWIVDEVLTSITKLTNLRTSKRQYLLANGKALHTISALLLHLVQTCTYGVRKTVRKALRTKQATALTKVDMAADNMDIDGAADGSRVSAVQEIVEPAVSSAMKIGRKIILFLLQKSGKGSKNSSEADYKTVYDHLVEDMLLVLYSPEWPVAEFLLNLCCRSMVTVLEDTKTSAEVNAAKSLCLEHLGPIVARLMKPLEGSTVKDEENGSSHAYAKSLASGDVAAIRRIFDAQHDVLRHLSTQQSLEEVGTSAADMLSAQWSMDVGQTLKSSRAAALNPDEDGESRRDNLAEARTVLENEISAMWDRVNANLKMPTEPRLSEAVCSGHLEMISASQGLRASADFFLDRIIAASASQSVTFRGKAIRSIGLIVAQDPAIFFKNLVRKAIDSRLLDNSPAVRDAAVELVGKYIGTRPDLAVMYYPQIAARIADKGLSVRKRVVKLLKQIYALVDENAEDVRIDICRKLISRVYDEDDNIKDLAMDAIEELWFSKTSDSMDLRTKSTVIMSVTAPLKERPSPMEETLKHVFRKHEDAKSLPALRKRCEDVANTLIDEWMNVAASDRDPTFSEVDCIKTIHVMTTFSPGLLSASKASLLLPFLKGMSTPEDQVISEYLLRIFRACVVDMPRSSGAKFGGSLQAILLPLINKPNFSNGGTTLQELVACFCAAINHQTHDYVRLVNVFKACEARLRGEVRKLQNPSTAANVNLKAMPVLMFLVSSFVEHGDLEEVRKQPTVVADINGISKAPMHEHVYSLLADAFRLISIPSARGLVLTCLGFLFRAYPMLMTNAQTMTIMDDIFASDNAELHMRLLKIMSDFLTSQSLKSTEEDEKASAASVDMSQLIGNVESFADSGVGLAVVQRYMSQVTKAALSPVPQLHKPAIDIVGYTIRQGLAHPISCLPVLVSLESSPDSTMAAKAFGLHSLLHTKRPELVHTRFFETTKAVFEHQTVAAGGVAIAGYRGSGKSLLAPWYSLLSQRRNWRVDFAKSLTKAFAIDPARGTASQADVDFARFVAEALATLEFKTQEELFTILNSINTSLAMYAYPALHHMGSDEADGLMDGSAQASAREITPQAARASLVLGLGFLVRDQLKLAYNLSDAKCAKHAAAGGKKSKVGDVAASRRAEVNATLQYDRMPAAATGATMASQEDLIAQRTSFADLVNNDATLQADDEDEEGEATGEPAVIDGDAEMDE